MINGNPAAASTGLLRPTFVQPWPMAGGSEEGRGWRTEDALVGATACPWKDASPSHASMV